MKNSSQRNNLGALNSVVSRAVSGFKPPEDLTVSQWADNKRRISPESAAEPGPWRTSRTPYLKEPMDAFVDPKVRNIVLVSASQTGKSEFELNCIGYCVDQDPGSILYIHPTLGDARKFSKLRVAPMIRDCKTLSSKVSEEKSRSSANTVLQKSFPGGMLTICGSESASALASTPVRYIFGDERDRWAASAGKEGDPWELAKARQTTFYNAKSVEVSTPTVKNASNIEDAYNEGTRERWCFQCPSCGEWHDIVFKSIKFEYSVTGEGKKKRFKLKQILWECPGCGCLETEAVMKKQPAQWIAENPDAYLDGMRSFWLNAFCSPWVSWSGIILQFLNAQGDPKKLQVVFNTKLGELWEERGELDDEDTMLRRREEYKAELPDGVLVLTCGVDTQDNRLEYEVVGHGHFGTTWGIYKGIIMGRPDTDEVWQRLDDVVDHVYRFENGMGLKISTAFVDSGGHFTQEVYANCRKREGKKVFAIRGVSRQNEPFTAPPRKTKIVIDGKYVGTCWRFDIGVDDGKQLIMDSLKVQDPDKPGYCHFPKGGRGYDHAYFTGLLSERLTYKKGLKNPWVWEKIPGHERNEPLDLRNYALAAFKALNPDLDAIERRMKKPPAAPVAKPQWKAPARSAADRLYGEW